MIDLGAHTANLQGEPTVKYQTKQGNDQHGRKNGQWSATAKRSQTGRPVRVVVQDKGQLMAASGCCLDHTRTHLRGWGGVIWNFKYVLEIRLLLLPFCPVRCVRQVEYSTVWVSLESDTRFKEPTICFPKLQESFQCTLNASPLDVTMCTAHYD